MYQLFKVGPLPNRGEQILPDFRRIRAGLQQNLAKVIEFRRLNPHGLNGRPHLLVKLLQNLNIPLSLDAEIYADKVTDVALPVAAALKLTSPLHQGKAFSPGVFYGEHVTEVIWANIDDFDWSVPWKDWQPIRVLYHPKNDLAMEVPDGLHDSQEAGMAVISVNVPQLATMYKLYRDEEKRMGREQQRSIQQFLMELPLPNMLHSHVDIAVMNRLICRYFGVDMLKIKPHHSYYLTDWTDDVDRALDKTLAFWQGKDFTFDALVSQIPTVSGKDLHELMALPGLASVRQVQWAVVIARLAVVVFLVQYNAQNQNTANQQYLNYLRRYLTQMDLFQVMRQALPASRYEDVTTLLVEGVSAYL